MIWHHRPPTSTGVALLVFVPLPNWPFSLLPQHLAPPAAVTTQTCVPPAATDFTAPMPITKTGVARSVVVPSPT